MGEGPHDGDPSWTANIATQDADDRRLDESADGNEMPRSTGGAWWSANRANLLILLVLWVLLASFYGWLANFHATPQRRTDEFLWWELAQSFTSGDGMTWRGAEQGIRSPLYVLYISLGFLPGWGTSGTYTAVHLLNALAMPAVVFPTFFVARRFVTRGWSFVAAVLSVAIAPMAFIGLIQNEALAYPVAALTLAAIVVAVSRPERRFWILATIAVIAAALTRTQFLALAAILPMAILILGALQPAGERLVFVVQRREPLIAYGAVLLAILVLLTAAPATLVGIYATGLDYPTPSVADLFYWLRNLSADLIVLTGIAPAVATLALMLDRKNWHQRSLGPLLAVTLAATVVLVGQTTWFAAASIEAPLNQHLFEVYLFYVAPLFFIAFAAFFRHVKPLPLGIATITATAIVVAFDGGVILVPFSYDSWGLTLVSDLFVANDQAERWIGALLALATLLVGAVLLLSARPSGHVRATTLVTVGICAGIMIASQASGWDHDIRESRIIKSMLSKPVDFIDRETDEEVGLLISKADRLAVVYATEFWNRRVTTVFLFPGTAALHSPTCTFGLGPGGEIVSKGCKIIPRAFYMRSKNVRMTFRDTEKVVEPEPGVRLIVAKGPAHVLGVVIGRDVVTTNVAGTMAIATFAAPGAEIEMEFAPAARLSINANGVTYKLRPDEPTTITLPLQGQNSTTTVSVLPGPGQKPNAKVRRVVLREPGRRPVELTQ